MNGALSKLVLFTFSSRFLIIVGNAFIGCLQILHNHPYFQCTGYHHCSERTSRQYAFNKDVIGIVVGSTITVSAGAAKVFFVMLPQNAGR